jgi:hypothetical protein
LTFREVAGRFREVGSDASLDGRAKDIIEVLYLDPRKPSIASVERGLKQFGCDLNYTGINRYVKNEIPRSVKTLRRKGGPHPCQARPAVFRV